MKFLPFAVLFAVVVPLYSQPTVVISPVPMLQFLDNNGRPLQGCIATYAAGTTTPLQTFSDSSGTVANPNPVPTDSSGRVAIWINVNAIKYVVKQKVGNICSLVAGTVLYTSDGIQDGSLRLRADLHSASGAGFVNIQPPGGNIIGLDQLSQMTIPDIAYNTFQAACNAAAGQGRTLVVSKQWTALPTMTCSAALQFLASGQLQPAAGATVTLSGPIDAAPMQIFDVSSGGTIAFTGSVHFLYAEWWGAKRDNATNDAAALNTAMTAAKNSGVTLALLKGTYLANGSGIILNALVNNGCNGQTNPVPCGVTIAGSGHQSTYIRTSSAGADLLSAVATGTATYPIYNFSGFTLVGPDAAHAGASSGNGLRISGGGPAIILRDIYARNFFGAGKAAFYLGDGNGMSLTDLRADLSDIGFNFIGGTNSDNIVSANNLQASQPYSYGFYMNGVGGGSWNNLSSQGATCTGFYLTNASLTINGLYMEVNNQSASASCHGLDLEGPVKGAIFNGIISNSSRDDIFLNGGPASDSNYSTAVMGNTFISSNAANGNQGPVTINNLNSTPNTWINWYGAKFTGAGNSGFDYGNFMNCSYKLLADGTSTVSGNAPCNLYQVSNSAPTTITNLPSVPDSSNCDGFTARIYVRDGNTTFNQAGNLFVAGGSYTAVPGNLLTFHSYCDNGNRWILTGY